MLSSLAGIVQTVLEHRLASKIIIISWHRIARNQGHIYCNTLLDGCCSKCILDNRIVKHYYSCYNKQSNSRYCMTRDDKDPIKIILSYRNVYFPIHILANVFDGDLAIVYQNIEIQSTTRVWSNLDRFDPHSNPRNCGKQIRSTTATNFRVRLGYSSSMFGCFECGSNHCRLLHLPYDSYKRWLNYTT